MPMRAPPMKRLPPRHCRRAIQARCLLRCQHAATFRYIRRSAFECFFTPHAAAVPHAVFITLMRIADSPLSADAPLAPRHDFATDSPLAYAFRSRQRDAAVRLAAACPTRAMPMSAVRFSR